MIEWITAAMGYVVPFLVVLTIVVFVHEWGHYLLARYCRVRVEVFSLGFGPELWGYTTSSGTRWRLSLIPLGGYVKMRGESGTDESGSDESGTGQQRSRWLGNRGPGNESDGSTESTSQIDSLAASDSFADKSLGQRAAIIAAGPAANFLFATVILAVLFASYGRPYTPAEVGEVRPGSAAERADLRSGDLIVAIEGTPIETFEDLQSQIRNSPGQALTLVVRRSLDGQEHQLTLTAIPESITPGSLASGSPASDSPASRAQAIGFLGIDAARVIRYSRSDPVWSLWLACGEVVRITGLTLEGLADIIQGVRSVKELGGPLRIAQLSGEMAQNGWLQFLWFIAILSVNLGFINLLPIPVLDGGHLMFQGIEALRRRPLSQRTQQYTMLLGLVVILGLMLLITWNDTLRLLN